MRQRAQEMGLPVAAVHIDNNKSAWQRGRSRPGWDAMLADIAAGCFTHVLAYDPDRLMRQPRDLEDLLEAADRHSVTVVGKVSDVDLSDSGQRFVLRVLIAQACKSSDDTSRRVLDALAEGAAAGRPHGGKRPFGFQADRITHDEDEAAVVREIAHRRAAGESPHGIADDLNGRGVLTAQARDQIEKSRRSGGAAPISLPVWRPVTIRALLTNPRTAGLRTHRGTTVRAVWAPLIEPSLWAELQELQQERTATWRADSAGWRFYFLSGLIRCGCGRRLYGHVAKSPVYYCPREQGGCGQTRISAEAVEAMLSKWIERRLATARPIGATGTVTGDPAAERAAESDESKLKELDEMFADGELTRPAYVRMKRRVEDRLKASRRSTVVRSTTALVGMTGADASSAWRDAPPPKRKVVARLLLDDVVVGPSTAPGVFDPSRVRITPAKL